MKISSTLGRARARALPVIAGLLPSRRDYRELRTGWFSDLLAGITVAVVALPLALGFGVASGLGAEAGIITAIVAGIVAGVFGGSDVQVSGPTGAMTVVLLPVVAEMGRPGVAAVALLSGVLLVGLGAARLGRYAAILPWPVIEGFTLGIAMLIFLQQVPAALGVDRPDDSNTAIAAISAIASWTGGWQGPGLVALVAGTMVLLPRLHHGIPASLVAITVATAVTQAFGVDVAEIGAIPSHLPAPTLPSPDGLHLQQLLSAVLAVTALAAIESLLSAKVADGMADGPPHDPDRELFGQGMANIAVATFGGMPATGAIARTAVNVRAGARSRAAAITHGVVLLIAVMALSPLLGRIPLAALAGVLMVTATRMVETSSLRLVLRAGAPDAMLLIATASATIVFDLVVAVAVGLVLASVMALRAMTEASTLAAEPLEGAETVGYELEHRLLDEHIVVYRLDGALFFGAVQRFLLDLADVTDIEVLILRFERLRVLDSTGAVAVAELIEKLEARGITVLLASVAPEHEQLLVRTEALRGLRHHRHLAPNLAEALEHARSHVRRALAPSV